MFNLSNEFERFYREKVVLPATTQNDLRKKKNVNINRLKSGLKEYNDENNTDYKISETRTQGSMAMHTVVQNDGNDFDIDVAIVFEEENLGTMGSRATKNMVAKALRKKTKQFNIEPEIKNSCVRIHYSDGYHVDFAIFRRHKASEFTDDYIYEHAGSEWTERGIRTIEDWFKDVNKQKDNKLRKLVRLSKMFNKSRDSWINMPGGLIQTILCEEQLTNYSRLDENFYYTMKNIVNRLDNYIEVYAPADNNRPLVNDKDERTKMRNWKNRLTKELEKLDPIFEFDCSRSEAITAWRDFFNNNYWTELLEKSNVNQNNYDDTEEFIEEQYSIGELYYVELDCTVSGNGFPNINIYSYIEKFSSRLKKFVPKNFSVSCAIKSTNAPKYDKVLWKVKNTGYEAEINNDIRGQIKDRGNKISENTKYRGNHYIECYLINDDVCIGIGYVEVPIGMG